VSRHRWEFDLEDGRHVVEFEQGYFLGNRKITIDGAKTTERGRPFMDHSGQYPIRLEGHGAAVWVTTNGFTYSFDLVVDGKSVTSGRTAARVPRPPLGGPRQMQALGVVAALIAIPLAFIAWSQGFDEYRYENASATASGVVDDKWTSAGRSSTTYHLSYAFVDRVGLIRRGSDSVSRASYDAARPGTTRVSIVYLQDDPSVNRFSGKDNVLTVVLLASGAAAVAATGGYLFWAGRREAAMIVRLNGIGQPATATVTKVKAMFMKGVGDVVRIEYAYDDPFGKRRRGRGPLMYPAEGTLYSVGGSVRILIDPDRPGDNALP
jgi:FAIM1 (Fas apoptotic inhibitory molecule) protein/uncharacterized protein DUF3592